LLHKVYSFYVNLFQDGTGAKKAIGADWSGLERTSEPKRFTLLYIAAGLIIRATARIAK